MLEFKKIDIMNRIVKYYAIFLCGAVIVLGGFLLYLLLRPNTSYVNPELEVESSVVEVHGLHPAFTDMVFWKGYFYLSFRMAADHNAPNSKIVIMRSTNAKDWSIVKEFEHELDIRDPHFGIFGNKLFIYVITRPTNTLVSYSNDGITWPDLESIEPANKRYWRPKIYAGIWYVPVFSKNKVELWKSTNGLNWENHSIIFHGAGGDETDIAFYPNGTLVASIRMQTSDTLFGRSDLGTKIAIANPPFTNWSYIDSDFNRIDGPCLFSESNKIFAVGRFQPEVDVLFQGMGSTFSKKRTALYLIDADGIRHLSDLLSCGDTSYPAAIVKDGFVYISYYSNPPTWDYAWFLGTILPTNIRIVKIEISKLNTLAESAPYIAIGFPIMDYIMSFALLAVSILVIYYLTRKIKSEKGGKLNSQRPSRP